MKRAEDIARAAAFQQPPLVIRPGDGVIYTIDEALNLPPGRMEGNGTNLMKLIGVS